ncbi:hypothetical protein CQA66_08295 [Helicobacter aurati]|uniref:Initiator Rep protein WH1 domain-containing protein n=1 Tax=Helicobacter aurati TaxID=137778 RepID=A0A3D8IYQ6_9HELI|nr:replication initiation protein [Helicobacter aurati]RDU70398.1 hypothetical protein CQA66_08295 [Helicobacter aurati]
MKENFKITLSNFFANLEYKISNKECKFFFMMLSKINVFCHDKNSVYCLDREEFYNSSEIENILSYQQIKSIIKKLRDKVAFSVIGNERKEIKFFEFIEYENQTIIYKFHEDFNPYISKQENNFSSIFYSELIHLKLAYSIKLYCYITSNLGKNISDFRIDFLKLQNILGVPESSRQYKYFRYHILKKVINEINQFTSVNIIFAKYLKTINEIRFLCKFKEFQEIKQIENNVTEIHNKIDYEKNNVEKLSDKKLIIDFINNNIGKTLLINNELLKVNSWNYGDNNSSVFIEFYNEDTGKKFKSEIKNEKYLTLLKEALDNANKLHDLNKNENSINKIKNTIKHLSKS